MALRRAHMTMGTSGAAVQPVTTEEANPDHYSTLVLVALQRAARGAGRVQQWKVRRRPGVDNATSPPIAITIDLYSHVMPTTLREAADAIDRALGDSE
jgi:hypothetical protein